MVEIDRKKFIRLIEEEISVCESVNQGYRTIDLPALRDILSLLKEQEAVEPSFRQDEKGIFVWCCGSCGAYMYHIYEGIDKAKEYAKYCRQCGKKVKWE